MTLLELAERCEAATGPDYDLDCAISDALRPDLPKLEPEPYTASLDAAMTLVPETAGFTLQQLGHPCIAQVFVPQRKEQSGCGYTPALALCAAALEARAAQPPGYDNDSESGALMDEPE